MASSPGTGVADWVAWRLVCLRAETVENRQWLVFLTLFSPLQRGRTTRNLRQKTVVLRHFYLFLYTTEAILMVDRGVSGC